MDLLDPCDMSASAPLPALFHGLGDGLPSTTVQDKVPLPKGPGAVNPALARDASLFPLDAKWIDLHHDKGQLARAPSSWIQTFFEQRIAHGESCSELMIQCWIMAHSGLNQGIANSDALLRIRPEAAFVLIDHDEAKPILRRLSLDFETASRDWTIPTDMAMRGWGKLRLEADIQSASRSKFAWISKLCAKTAEIGIPEMLRRSSQQDFDWLGASHNPVGDELEPSLLNRWRNPPQGPHCALAFMLRARCVAWPGSPKQTPEQLIELLTLCCRGFSPKNFRAALTQLCPDVLFKAQIGGSVIRHAVLSTHAELINIQLQLALIEPLAMEEEAATRAKEPEPLDDDDTLCDYGYYDDEFVSRVCFEVSADQSSLCSVKTFAQQCHLLRTKEREASQRAERARDALAHLANWAQSQKTSHPSPSAPFFESTLGCSFSDQSANEKAEDMILSSSTKLKMSNYALGLAQCALDYGYPLCITQHGRAAVWRSHHDAFKNMHASNIPKTFSSRHLALAMHYPHEEGERSSRALAPAEQLAHIEFAEISQILIRYSPDSLGEDSVDEDEPPAPTRKLRL
jgi:hypothetical protein